MFLRCPGAWPTPAANDPFSSSERDCQYVLKSIRDYHHKVTPIATPFGEFTKWCESDEMSDMDSRDVDIQEKRRDILRAYIRDVLKISVNAFALEIGGTPSFYSELLSGKGKRAFRESLAEKLEDKIRKQRWPAVALRQPDQRDNGHWVADQIHEPWPFDFDYKRYDRLSERQKGIIEGRLIAVIEQYEEAENAGKVVVPRRKKSTD
jgi:hypothetical protein